MKKIFFPLLIAAATLGFATSCSEDRDSNPVLNTSGLTLVLNTPGISINNTYDLANSEYITLTTSQPNYGYPASTTYTPFVSLDGDKWQVLETTYTTARMNIPASEINQAMLDLVGEANTDQLTVPKTIYMKVSAALTATGAGYVESNTITLPSVLAYVPAFEITLPEEMYIVGSFAASNGWSTFVPMHFAYSQEGFSYAVVYFEAGDEFKINPDAGWKGNDKGFGQVTYGEDAAGIVNGGNSETGNMKVSNAGWYTVIVKNKIAGTAITYEVSTREAKVYVFGATAPADQWSFNDGNLFTMSSSASDPCVSPALGGSGELRLAIDCGIDWWKTEFTIKNSDGTLYYRDVDVPSNWASALGDDYSYQGAAGQNVYIDFTNGTGYVK